MEQTNEGVKKNDGSVGAKKPGTAKDIVRPYDGIDVRVEYDAGATAVVNKPGVFTYKIVGPEKKGLPPKKYKPDPEGEEVLE